MSDWLTLTLRNLQFAQPLRDFLCGLRFEVPRFPVAGIIMEAVGQ